MISKLGLLKKSFKKRFIDIVDKFNDTREIVFLNNRDDSKFWFLHRMQHEYVAVSWTETFIEVKFNDNLIVENFLMNQRLNDDFLQNYFIRVANHEYGHTISYKSVFYSLFPEDTRHIVMNKSIDEITENDIEYCFKTSKSEFVELLSLKNLDIALFQRNFIEFWANLMVYEKIDDNPPNEFLSERLKDLTSENYLSYSVLCNPTVKLNENIFLLLGYTGEFFIFDKWQDLIEIFTKRNLNKLLDFYRYINSFFHKILEINDEFDLMRADIIELSKIMDKIDYNDLVKNNKINSKNRQLLRFYINYLKNKEVP